MSKRSVLLTLISVCGVITAFAYVAANTIRTNNARQSVVSTGGFEYPRTETVEKAPDVTKGVAVSIPVTPPEEEISEEPEPETVPVVATEDDSYIMPVSGGEVIGEFTDTALVFQETYGDYRTHLGIDIEAAENTPVVSVRDGIVIKSEADYEQGYVVEIEHKDGVVSVYKNLTTNEMAPVGKVVSKGETIGAVGTSGIFEGHLPAHLHNK